MALEIIIIFVAKSIASQIVKDTFKNKVLSFLFPKDTYATRLAMVIHKTIEEYEKQYPKIETRGNVQFYHSQILFENLSSFILFMNGSFDEIENKFHQNPNIIIPDKKELYKFYMTFLNNVNKDNKLKKLFIGENYKDQIFNNTQKLSELFSLITATKKNTDLILKRLDNKFISKIPKELTTLIPKLKQNKIIGRETNLIELEKRLFENKQVVLMNGMGGIGKTALASVYLTEFYDSYNHIAWITTTENGFFSDLISSPGLLESLNIDFDDTIEKTFNSAKIRLNSLKAKNLMIIDNATTDLAEYYSYLPNQPNWHLIITSREIIENFDIMEIGFLNEEEAVNLFKMYYTREKLDDEYIKELVKNVEYHTLTIEILSKTAQDLRISFDLLNKAIESNLITNIFTRHRNRKVGKILSYLTSIFDLSKLTEDAITILKYFTLLPTEYIKNQELEKLLSFIKEKLPAGRAELINKGWILYNEEEDAYKLHQIILDVVNSKWTYDIEFAQPLIESLESIISVNLEKKENPISKFKWIPYGKKLLRLFETNNEREVFTLQNNLATILQNIGDYNGAKVFFEKAKNISENIFGKININTTTIYSNLATTFKLLGDYSEAKILLEEALKNTQILFDEYHPNTAIVYSNLGTILQSLGDYNGAKTMFEKAIFSAETHLGINHPTTANRYSNLALVLQDLGDLDEAKILLEKSIKIKEDIFNEDHPTIAISYSSLAMILKIQGNLKEAKIIMKKVTISAEKNFGNKHPTTANRYSNLALVLQDLGEFDEAKLLLEKSIIINENKLGEIHLTTAISYSNLGFLLQKIGKVNEAKVLLEKSYNILLKINGIDDPKTIKIKNSLILLNTIINQS